MTRASRMVLVMGLLSIGGVASLAFMAHRYSAALERRSASVDRRAGGAAAQALPEGEAERLVAAYLDVRRALEQAPAGNTTGRAAPLSVREGLDAALAARGLTLAQYRELDRLAHAWRAGSADVPSSYRAALERLAHR